jgi:hypothetical protein
MSLVIPAKAGIQILWHYRFRIKCGMTNHLIRIDDYEFPLILERQACRVVRGFFCYLDIVRVGFTDRS